MHNCTGVGESDIICHFDTFFPFMSLGTLTGFYVTLCHGLFISRCFCDLEWGTRRYITGVKKKQAMQLLAVAYAGVVAHWLPPSDDTAASVTCSMLLADGVEAAARK